MSTASDDVAESEPPGSGHKPRVLVIDDDVDMNRFVARCLAAHFEVSSAFDAQQGLTQALQERPSLVVSDGVMPGGGGDLLAELRKQPALRSTPVLLLSAAADHELIVKPHAQGAQDFIVRPFSARELLVRARNLVVTQQAREAVSQALAKEHGARELAELQQRQLHALLMQAPTLLAVLRGPEHVVELANGPICQAWGVAPHQVIGKPLITALPAIRDQVYPSLLQRVYTTGVPYVSKEAPVRLDRGGGKLETVYFNFVYAPYRNIEGEIAGLFVIAADVSPLVLAREQVTELRDAAQSAHRATEEFLIILGDELLDPLSPMLEALQVMKERGEPGLEHERSVIERQLSQLTRLVDDLLEATRIARGRVELALERVDLIDVVAKALEMASAQLGQSNQRVKVDVPRGLQVDADPRRLSQAIANLLTNAAKYTPPGGEVSVRAQHEGGALVLRVRDSGVGITPELLPHVFDLFLRERPWAERARGGLGIGLSIVRSLVERHGGSVSVHSAGPGQGSEFVLRLPKALEDEASA